MSPENELELTRSLLRREQVERLEDQKAAAIAIAIRDAVIADQGRKIRAYEEAVDALVAVSGVTV